MVGGGGGLVGGAIFQNHILIQIFEARNCVTKKYFLVNEKQEICKCYWNWFRKS